ncbi:MAG: DUF4340 domain-containing protein [Thiolinea sp.]
MKVAIMLLAALAAVQVVLAVITHSGGTQVAGESVHGMLLEFDKAAVDQLVVQSAGSNIELKKSGDRWQTADGFPANAAKVTGLLDKLAELKYGLPVGVSEDALSRFKVADDDFERHLLLKQGDKVLADLYLGSGAGARQSHVRRAAEQTVYTTALGSYDLAEDAGEWQDKTVLQLDEKSVKTVELGELKLEKISKDKETAPVWQAAKLADGKLLNQANINEALQPLWNLRFAEVLGKEAQDSYGLAKPALTLKLTYEQGEREYRFGKMDEGDDYVLKVSDREEYFRVAGYSVKPLVEKNTVENWLLDEAADAQAGTEAETDSAVTEDVPVEEESTADTEATKPVIPE